MHLQVDSATFYFVLRFRNKAGNISQATFTLDTERDSMSEMAEEMIRELPFRSISQAAVFTRKIAEYVYKVHTEVLGARSDSGGGSG